MNRKVILFLVVFVCSAHAASAQGRRLDPSVYFLKSEMDRANTAANEDYLNMEEKDIYLYTNLARLHPRKFYQLYRAFAIVEGKESELSRNKYYTTLTLELRSRDASEAVYPDKEMFELAKCWAIESGEKGLVGHNREECPKGFAGENCAYGYSTGLDIVMQLLIDEGVPNYGHRVNLLHPDWRGMGAAIRTHRDYRFCAVQNFSRTNDAVKEEERVRKEERDLQMAERANAFIKAMEEWNDDEIQAADVTRSIPYLNELEKDLYFYTNLMRLNPKKFKKVIWDQGPFFNQLLPELKESIHQEDQYRIVSAWLETARPQRAVVPEKKRIEALRCVLEKFLAGERNQNDCFTLAGGWRIQTYYSESNFNDVMNILLTPDDFQDLFAKNGSLALHKSEPSVKAFFTPN